VDSAFPVLAIEDTNSSFCGSERNVTFLHFIAFLLLFSSDELTTCSDISGSSSRKKSVDLQPKPGKTRWSLSCRDRSVSSYKCHLVTLCVRIMTDLRSLVSTKCNIFMIIVISLQ
jgi:hypothetical protein